MEDDSREARLFAAIELPEEWRSILARQSERLQSVADRAVKWVRPELMHITLVFLGNQPRGKVEEIAAAMDTAALRSNPFQLSLGKPGAFGSPERLRTLWVGLRDAPAELVLLHGVLVSQLVQAQVNFDRKPLVPHITIGRIRAGVERAISLRLHAELQRPSESRPLSTRIGEIVLLESRLHPQGPEYLPIHRARLGGSPGER
jgi:RNA 2',3'-cyclic 3'-phosphodiesterase